MIQYDAIVVGNDLSSLITALFLSRKMRRVLVVRETKTKVDDVESVTITDPENRKYQFRYLRENVLYGYAKESLLWQYLKSIGMEESFQLMPLPTDIVVDRENQLTDRIFTFESWKVYLVRYFPKQRDQVHRFFDDLERHYQNFVTQYLAMLTSQDYTITSLMIEWGDYSLLDLLLKYFSDGRIIEEFLMNNQINGLDPSEVNSYHFFMNLFLGLKDGAHVRLDTTGDWMKLLEERLLVLDPNAIKQFKIKEYLTDESKKITGIVDASGEIYQAKYVVVEGMPKAFYQKHFPALKEEVDQMLLYYPNLDTVWRVNTLYLALSQKNTTAGIQALNYYFQNDYSQSKRILRLFNYKEFDKSSCLAQHGAVCIDFVYREDEGFPEDEILKRVYDVFPKLKKSVVGVKLGKPKPYLSMLSDPSVRKNLTVNDQIAIEAGEHHRIFDNLYLIGRWMAPEASTFGQIHSAIVLGDKLEERLTYGEDDDTFYYLSNDEIMMMMRANFGKHDLGPSEQHINFHIGKSDYFVRLKKKNITIHRGEYPYPDLSIYSTNDKLSNLLLKKATFEEVLKSGGFKYLGKKEMLYQAVTAFGLDDYRDDSGEIQIKTRYKFPGMKFFFAYMLVYGTAAFLSNYFDVLYIMPATFVLILGIGYWKRKVLSQTTWFEYVLAAIPLTATAFAIAFPTFNAWHKDDVYLLMVGLTFFVSWIINAPVFHEFHRHDYRFDYANTKLFRVINNGLTFFWSLIYLAIFAIVYISGERYVSVLYNLIFLGIFMSYYYPVMYVKTNIKR